MTETQRRGISKFLLQCDFLPLNAQDENFLSIDLTEDTSQCYLLSCAWRVVNNRVLKNLCDSVRKESFNQLSSSLGCELPTVEKQERRERFIWGIPV